MDSDARYNALIQRAQDDYWPVVDPARLKEYVKREGWACAGYPGRCENRVPKPGLCGDCRRVKQEDADYEQACRETEHEARAAGFDSLAHQEQHYRRRYR